MGSSKAADQTPHDQPEQKQQQEPQQEQQGPATGHTGGAVKLPAARRLEGLAYLLAVTLLWGSYTPALRLVYSLPSPPPPLVLTAATGCLELAMLLTALLLSSSRAQQALTAAAAPAEGSDAAASEGSGGGGQGLLLLGLPAALLAGLEIGLYNSAATFSQTAGLSLTTATRGAFLVQASTLFTPVLASMAGMAPSRTMWLGSLLALGGALIITVDGTAVLQAVQQYAAAVGCPHLPEIPTAGVAASTAASAAGAGAVPAVWPVGEALTVFAALCYSAATVRLPVWSLRYGVSPLQLSLGKTLFLTAVSAAALGMAAAQLAAVGQPAAGLWPGWQQPQAWAIMLWVALGPGSLGSVLHVKGQSLMSPTEAQIVFCSVPLWSALLAAVVLPDEPVGMATWLGGGVIAAAGLVAALPSSAARWDATTQRLK